MKNLLKSVMLVFLIVPNFGCESESIDEVNPTNSLRESSFSTSNGPCENLQSVAKFVNNGSYDTDFIIYDSDHTVLTSESLSPNNTSDLKSISSLDKVTVVIRNSENSFVRTFRLKTCMVYSFLIDVDNEFIMNNFAL